MSRKAPIIVEEEYEETLGVEIEKKALQYKSLAEESFKQSKLKSALKYAKRAHRLSPNLDGASELATVFNILHVYSKSSAGGGPPHWYQILQVEPFSHINLIRKQYKKLALILHPDKNSCIGSEDAFKHVAEGFRVLNDKIRRKEYDVKLRIALQSQAISAIEQAETFWTACSTCRLLHEFERRYLGHNLVCPSCNKSFRAVEVAVDDELGEEDRVGDKDGVGSRVSPEKGNVDRPKRIVTMKRMSDFSYSYEGLRTSAGSHSKRAKTKPEMTLAEMQLEVKRKLREQMMKAKEKAEKYARGEAKDKERKEVKRKGNEKAVEVEGREKGTRDVEVSDKQVKDKERGEKMIPQRSDMEVMVVEDSDFYDFDDDRTERSFKKGQVWAVYDDDDGMPRQYGLIDEVVSVNPFEIKMSWLDIQNNGIDALICLEKPHLHASCGQFKVSRKISIDSVNVFSHAVVCERMAREIYWIYPSKGSIWALYKGKGQVQDCGNQVSEDRRSYDIVLCLTSYSEMHGLSIACLEKVEGFKTVFKRREIGYHAIRYLEKEGLHEFSHQIPAKKLSGAEATDLPNACWELDPASLPQHLLGINIES
ncbi:hypothetical protein Syun_005334 [Stephania yunnanensis]|uniref:J domain-containing protein n=1 Tax=Stephania yunnanensis TaxID=152371 RepID=A0AAP0L616_9MAGN